MLAHVTSVGGAREILRCGQLETRNCPVFNRPLVYTFALRPAYKSKNHTQKQSVLDYFPSVFLLKADALGDPYHVYPFDTGGARSGAFDEAASDHVYLEDYELASSLQAAADHIEWAFGSRANYFDGQLKAGLRATIPDWNTCAITFYDIALLAQEGSNQPDKRASSIEIAFRQHINLKQAVDFAILPRQFLEHPRGNNDPMINALKQAQIEWECYDWQPNSSPSDFQVEISALVRNYYARSGVL